MNDVVYVLLMIMDIGTTLINLAVLGLAIKLYTDQTKQSILRGKNNDDTLTYECCGKTWITNGRQILFCPICKNRMKTKAVTYAV